MTCFKGVHDFVVFTNKRLVAVNVQGITGEKRDSTSLPYSKIQAFSVETAGTFDLDAELDLWFSGLGIVRAKPERRRPDGCMRDLSEILAGSERHTRGSFSETKRAADATRRPTERIIGPPSTPIVRRRSSVSSSFVLGYAASGSASGRSSVTPPAQRR